MRFLSVLLFFAFFFVFSGVARAQLAKPQIADNESGVDQVLLQKNDGVLYVTRWSYTRTNEGGKSYLIWKAKGDNAKQGAERIDWTEEGKTEEAADGLRTVYWKKRSTGAEQMDWEMRYDWAAGRCVYSFADRAANKKELKTITIDKRTIPGDALYLVLRGFPFEKGAGAVVDGQVLQGDGTMAKGQIIHRGAEKITTPLGTFDAYKLELKPTGVLGALPTKLYMWFEKDAPHKVLRFDGFEGLARTKTVLTEHQAK